MDKSKIHASSFDILVILEHDINNLLGVVKGYLDLALLDKDSLCAKVKEGLVMARGAAEELSCLIFDFTDVAKMEEKKLSLNLEKTDINSIISGVIKKIRPLAIEERVDLKERLKKEAVYCNIDKILIPRVLINLISSAIKSTPERGSVNVTLDVNKNNLRVTVKDTGFWIPPDYRKKIFEKDALPVIRKVNLGRGYGLGLAFCKLAIEAHGGKIWVESEGKGKGSKFIFTIPRNILGDTKRRVGDEENLSS